MSTRLNKEGDTVTLWGQQDGELVAIDVVSWEGYVQAAARIPDGGPTWETGETPTPGAPNG